MSAIDWVELSKLAPGIAQVVIFIVFVLKMMERQDKRDAIRDAAFLKSIEGGNIAWQKTITDNENKWRETLEHSNTTHINSLDKLADEMKTIGHLASATNMLVAQHDQWERIELEHRLPERELA